MQILLGEAGHRPYLVTRYCQLWALYARVFTLFTLFTLFFNSAKRRFECKKWLIECKNWYQVITSESSLCPRNRVRRSFLCVLVIPSLFCEAISIFNVPRLPSGFDRKYSTNVLFWEEKKMFHNPLFRGGIEGGGGGKRPVPAVDRTGKPGVGCLPALCA